MSAETLRKKKILGKDPEAETSEFLRQHVPVFKAPTDPLKWSKEVPRLRKAALANVYLKGIPDAIVNATGYYRVLSAAMREGVRRVVYASSLSVYSGIGGGGRRVNEHDQPNATDAYGVTKRLGEVMNDMFAQKFREATLISLRLMWPRNEKDWPGNEYKRDVAWCPTGPSDLRRLFLAALDCRTPGSHVVQASGDLEDRHFPNIQVEQLLGWRPEGR
jgi:hypothetical protein